MHVTVTPLPGVLLMCPQVHPDARGYLLELWQAQRYQEAGLPATFVQVNQSASQGEVLRGLHYQLLHPQGKLVSAILGEIFDVAVDIRPDSPTFRQWVGYTLSDANHHQLYIPPGYAHGFCVLSAAAHVLYACTDYYSEGDTYALRWNDPALGIDWPLANPRLSESDRMAPVLATVPWSHLPLAEVTP
jgi:dTDP-4-dehydrorhamnose 3,5-epimerase